MKAWSLNDSIAHNKRGNVIFRWHKQEKGRTERKNRHRRRM